MSIKNLVDLLHPPTNPVEVGSELQWHKLQQQLGIKLPSDFRDFGMTYGSGSIVDANRLDIFIYQPFSSNYLETVEFHSANLSAFKFSEGNDYVPFPVYPEPNGLLVWGGDVNGNELYWLIEGKPEDWRIVIRSESGEYQQADGPMTTFLARALQKQIDVDIWPSPFFENQSGLSFVPHKKLILTQPSPTNIYSIYVENGSVAGFWVRDVGDQPGCSYLVKTIDGLTSGMLEGVPREYKRQKVVADFYIGNKLFQESITIDHAHRLVFEQSDSPLKPSE